MSANYFLFHACFFSTQNLVAAISSRSQKVFFGDRFYKVTPHQEDFKDATYLHVMPVMNDSWKLWYEKTISAFSTHSRIWHSGAFRTGARHIQKAWNSNFKCAIVLETQQL